MITSVRTLSLDEQARIQTVLDPLDFLAVDFALQTGLRSIDQARLRFADVEQVTQRRAGVLYQVAIATVGLQRRRLVPLNTRATAIVHQLRPLCGTEYVFKDLLTTMPRFREAAAQVGVEGLRWADLRPTLAARALKGGATFAEVGVLLGHLPPDGEASFWAAACALGVS